MRNLIFCIIAVSLLSACSASKRLTETYSKTENAVIAKDSTDSVRVHTTSKDSVEIHTSDTATTSTKEEYTTNEYKETIFEDIKADGSLTRSIVRTGNVTSYKKEAEEWQSRYNSYLAVSSHEIDSLNKVITEERKTIKTQENGKTKESKSFDTAKPYWCLGIGFILGIVCCAFVTLKDKFKI